MTIKWISFLQVALATFLGSSALVLFYGLGVRFGAQSAAEVEGGRSGALFRALSILSFIVVGAAVLWGIWLIVPALGGKGHH